jgi:hypothetical protein
MNGMPSPYPYIRSLPQPYQPAGSHFPTPTPSNSLSTNLLHHLLRQKGEMLNQDFYRQHQPAVSFDEPMRYKPSSNFIHSPRKKIILLYFKNFLLNSLLVSNATSSIVNTPVTSPYSNQNPSHDSSVSSSQVYHNNPVINNGTQPSPAIHPASSYNAPKKRFLSAMKQETQDDEQPPIVDEDPSSPPTLKIIPDIDSPVKKVASGFLIGTPTSTGASSSSSTSSHTHFNYDVVLPEKKRDSTPSSFQWPSQFRRQLSLNIGYQTSIPIPSTPYTPPPMLSPFRKGPGLYYRVFSHPGPSTETSSIPTTPIGEDSTSPKINIGKDHQAIIPQLRLDINDEDDLDDELLFSPSEIPYLDEKSLEKFEQLNRMNPFLFSPRHCPRSYPLELVYMLLHEYNGDLPRTLASLLEGSAKDIKQCRPLHRYHFSECDQWTKEEISAFTKAIQTSEKNFELVSRAVRDFVLKFIYLLFFF